MALITINGVAVLSGTISMPRIGVWNADLVIDQPDGTGFDAGTAVTIQSENGFVLIGTVAPDRSGDFLDAVHVRVLGGAGGLAKQAIARSFVQPGAFAGDVLNSILGDAGETLSSTADSTFTSTNLLAWSVLAEPVSQALTTLISFVDPGKSWRILADGTLWIGDETWPANADTFVLLEQNPSEQIYDLGVDAPSVLAGQSIAGIGNIDRVEHQILDNKIRARVWTNIPGTDRGTRPAIATIIEQEISHLDYRAFYGCTIISQSGDLTTVDLMPDLARIGGLQRVRLCHGIPGTTVGVAAGSKVLLGWEGGDPRLPFACLWQGGETLSEPITVSGAVAAQQLLGAALSAGTVSIVALTGPQAGAAILDSAGETGIEVKWTAPHSPVAGPLFQINLPFAFPRKPFATIGQSNLNLWAAAVAGPPVVYTRSISTPISMLFSSLAIPIPDTEYDFVIQVSG